MKIAHIYKKASASGQDLPRQTGIGKMVVVSGFYTANIKLILPAINTYACRHDKNRLVALFRRCLQRLGFSKNINTSSKEPIT